MNAIYSLRLNEKLTMGIILKSAKGCALLHFIIFKKKNGPFKFNNYSVFKNPLVADYNVRKLIISLKKPIS